MRIEKAGRRGLCALSALLVPLIIGCGGGRAQLVPVMRSDLPASEPLVQDIPFAEAYYAVEPDERVLIGLRRHARSLAPGRELTWQMSIVLQGTPAGRERLYRVTSPEVRATQSFGGDHRRWRSTLGLVSLEAPSNGRLRGRFHLTVQQQQFGVLHGWTPPIHRGAVLTLVGSFEAIRDDAAARDIVASTEADGFDRLLRPIRTIGTTTTSAPDG